MSFSNLTRRGLMKTGAVAGAGLALPTYLSAASHSGFTNAPQGDTVTLTSAASKRAAPDFPARAAQGRLSALCVCL